METTNRHRAMLPWALSAIALGAALTAAGEVRVQDVTHLQGRRTNKLMGYGLVVGLNGTGDGGKNEHTMRALMAMHRKFHQPVMSAEELKNTNNVAMVAVEATIPEYGAREGQTVDVAVSAFSAESLKGGRLLMTPLQFPGFNENDPATQQIMGFAGGWIEITDSSVPTRGMVREGCTLEQDFFYNFILDGAVTLVLDDKHAGYQWSKLVAESINAQVTNLAELYARQESKTRGVVPQPDIAEAIGPKNVLVRIPPYELAKPASFIDRVLQAVIFQTPAQPARVCINRTTGHISFTDTVTIAPTILQLPGLGTLGIGGESSETPGGLQGKDENVKFQELLNTLSKLQLQPEQMIAAVEHLHRTGTLHAQLVYTE